MSEKITWSLVPMDWADIKTNPDNPKTVTRKGLKRLQKSLERFGRVFDGIVNADGMLIDGHSRSELKTEGQAMVFKPSRQLSPDEYKEMNAIFDIAKGGETNEQMLEQMFTDEFFQDWDLEKKKGKDQFKKDAAQYPIVAEYDEKYEAIIIVCSNSIDTTYIKNALGIGREQSYKNSMVKETSVVSAQSFIEKWDSRNGNQDSNSDQGSSGDSENA